MKVGCVDGGHTKVSHEKLSMVIYFHGKLQLSNNKNIKYKYENLAMNSTVIHGKVYIINYYLLIIIYYNRVDNCFLISPHVITRSC